MVQRLLVAMAAFLLALALPAQSVKFANFSESSFSGWKRITMDALPPHPAGKLGNFEYVVGRKIGRDRHAVDVRVKLSPGEKKTVDLGTFQVSAPPSLALPANLLAMTGGPATINGKPMQLVSAKPDGAAWISHSRARVPGGSFHVDLWVTWWPDQPGWCEAEFLVNCCHPNIPSMVEAAPAMRLQFGDAITFIPGSGFDGLMVKPGETFAHGQAMAKPCSFVWLRHLKSWDDFGSARAAADMGISGIGIKKLWPTGNPTYRPNFNPASWLQTQMPGAVAALHDLDQGGRCGPAKQSGVTGAQEGQVFVRGEALLPDGYGCEIATYLAGLKLFNRPCHFIEVDGTPITQEGHPRLVLWSGRPHWHTGVSPDQLNRPRGLTESDTHGWSGADREHWLVGTSTAGARYRDSRALQRELETQARQFLFSETTQRGWSTSGPDAARSIGWAGILAAYLFENLEDRALAEKLAQRWRDRVTKVYIPRLSSRPGDIWDDRLDARLGFPAGVRGWMPWQQSIGAYGLWLGCEVCGPEAGKALALAGAKACVLHNWVMVDGENRYRSCGNVEYTHTGKPENEPYASVPNSVYTKTYFDGVPKPGIENPKHWIAEHWIQPPRSNYFPATWDVPAVVLVRTLDPGHEKARVLWDQIRSELGNSRRSWFPPESDWR